MSIDNKELRWLSEQTINGPQLGRKGLAECHAAIPMLLDEIERLKKAFLDMPELDISFETQEDMDKWVLWRNKYFTKQGILKNE